MFGKIIRYIESKQIGFIDNGNGVILPFEKLSFKGKTGMQVIYEEELTSKGPKAVNIQQL